MKNFGLKLIVAVGLMMPGLALAQPAPGTPRAPRGIAGTTTGLTDAPPGMAVGVPKIDPNLLKDYMRSVEAIDMAVDFETRGETRRQLGVSRISVTSTWERRPGIASPVLSTLRMKPTGGPLNMNGFKINEVTIDRDGKMHLDIKGYPDVTVSKISKDADGNIKLHLDWLPDITIRRDGDVKLWGFIGLGSVSGLNDLQVNWPPRLEDVMYAIEHPPAAGEPGTMKLEGAVSWDLRTRAGPYPFPIGAGNTVAASTSAHIRGAAVIEPDGTFRTVGNANTATLEVRVGERNVAAGPVAVDVRSATATFNGTYGVTIPMGNADRAVLDVDGGVRYSAAGRNLVLNLPTGTRLRAGEVAVDGNGRITARVAPGGASVVLRDGTYRMDVNGPIGVTGLNARGVTAEELGFTGNLHSEGSFEPLSNGLAVRGNATGELIAANDGVVDVLMGNRRARGTIRTGSRVALNLDEVTADVGLDATGSPVRGAAAGRGRVEAGLDLGGIAASDSTGSFAADRARLDASFAVDASTDEGLRSARGNARVRLDSDGRMAMNNLTPLEAPGAGSVEHRIVAGESLHRIARRYGVTVPALRAANGLADDTIRAGSTLRVPGRSAPQPASGPGNMATTVNAGSEVALVVSSARTVAGGFEVDGAVSSRVRISGLDIRSGKLETKILGAARASLDTSFRVRMGADGKPLVTTGTVRVPVRIEINAGSRLQVLLPGNETDVVMDKDGSYAEFTAVVRMDATGMHVDELAACDLLLISNGTARFGGNITDIPGEKSIQYTGRIVIRDRGLDMFGDIAVRVRGPADRPIIRIRW